MILIREADTAQAGSRLGQQKGAFMLRWLNALDDYNAVSEAGGDVVKAAASMRREWHATIDDVFTEAYREGLRMWGARADLPLPDGILREIERQKQYAFRFVLDHARGFTSAPGRMSAAARSAMYGQAIENAYQRGAVDASPPGQLIWWRLGSGDPCSECPQLAANSPYTRETLPKYPKSGTKCRSKCKCWLEFTPARGVQVVRDPPPSGPDAAEQARSIRDRVEGPRPRPPPGRRLPTAEEERIFQDLELRMNFASRRADAATDKTERQRWDRVRKDLQKRSIEFRDATGTWWVPSFSSKEVLTGADIRAGDVSWLTHHRGIDGTTIHRAQAAAIEEARKAAEADLARLLKNLPSGNGPIVPALDDLMRAAKASREAAPVEPRSTYSFRATEALAPLPATANRVVVHLVALGAEQTVATGLALVAACREEEYPIDIGPLDEGWIETALFAGIFLEGPAEKIAALLGRVNELVGDRGVEAVTWQG